MGAKARLAQAESQYENAQATYERNSKLHKNNVISDSEFDQAKANYEVAKAEVKAAEESVQAAKFNVKSSEATLSEAEENLGRTSIYSPMSGVITKLNREKGERVVGTAQMAGTEIMTVADLSVMEVAVEVNENDIVRVDIGDTTEIEVDAYLDENFIGVVTEIANSAKVEGVSADQVTNFDVKIRMIQTSYQHLMESDSSYQSPFRPGMSASVDIRTKEAKDVWSVPIQAVTTRAESSASDDSSSVDESESEAPKMSMNEGEMKECIFVAEDGKAKQVFVKTGIQNTMHIEIKEGLSEGDEIISGPYTVVSKLLKDGQEIEIVKKNELFNRSKK
jgi:HlyD family secretion protein